jgi:hypothetical protein
MLLRASMVEGNAGAGVMAGGQVTGLIEDLPSCAELIDRIVREAEQILHGFGTASFAQRAQVSRSEPQASEGHQVGERRPSGGQGN